MADGTHAIYRQPEDFTMKRMIGISVAALSLLAAGCGGGYSDPPPPPGYVALPPMAPDEHTVYAPMAPPPMQAEIIPPPPNGRASAVYWVPGNWKWYGTADGHSGWQWTAGHYVERPNSNVAWQPGHWQQNNNGYFWVDGYWQ
jgi:hypothetical protein